MEFQAAVRMKTRGLTYCAAARWLVAPLIPDQGRDGAGGFDL
ncbi:MAG: hypothetical protein ACJAZW_003042 [Maritalea sp.]|jgi:hypothetical protein